MRDRFSGLLIALALLTFIVVDGCGKPRASADQPRAVILIIGDGLGISQVSFARYLHLGAGDRFRFESLPVTALMSTYSASNRVTDSGAAATTLASGVKTDNAVVGVDPQLQPVETLADRARAAGWRVGLVTNTAITHATPAAFYAHVENRYRDVDRIAEQLLDFAPDLALGGGRRDFLPVHEFGRRQDTRNLIEEAEEAGFQVIDWDEDWSLSSEAQSEGKLLGLFAGNHLPYVLDRQQLPEGFRGPRLVELTRLALDRLSAGDEPFFLMLEGGRIDHAGHGFDAAGVAAEVVAFDEAVAAVLDYQQQNPDTLVVLTADHSTGGLAVNDFTDWELLGQQQASIEWIVSGLRDVEDPMPLETARTLSGIADLTPEEIEEVRGIGDSYEANRVFGRILAQRQGITWLPRIDPWETKGHTGEDVPLYAGGPGAEIFQGVLDNAELPGRLAKLAGWE